jgi:hypothetical protein
MGSVVRLADRIERTKDARRVRQERGGEQRFRYPGPDEISEVSCHPTRRREPRHDSSTRQRVG